MNSIRVQIHLKYMFDEKDNSSKEYYNFWYAFEISKMLTINDIIEDIRVNYLNNTIENSLIVHLDECQLLPFTSSQILRDNDRLILIPLEKYKLSKKLYQDSVSLNLLPSTISIEQPIAKLPENIDDNKRQRVDSVEQPIVSQSTITFITSNENYDQAPQKKKAKSNTSEEQVAAPMEIEPKTTQSTENQLTSQISNGSKNEDEIQNIIPQAHGRIKELKSKTPVWKTQKPGPRGKSEDKKHIRFDSDSEEESMSPKQITNEQSATPKPLVTADPPAPVLPTVNGSNSSVRIKYISENELNKECAQTKKKKTVDLLFEMKQHKTVEEQERKKFQKQINRKRSRDRKQALAYMSMARFVDRAFGIDKSELENQILVNEYNTSSSSPQSLPTSFSKIARLPLVSEVIESNDKIYDLYPPVTSCPSTRTRIAFKLLELGDDFCPKMSKYKEGIVTDINQTTGELVIQLDQPLETVFNQPSKFYAPLQDETEENMTTVVLPFTDLNSVRLLPTSNDSVAK